jgi:hypothetical protein
MHEFSWHGTDPSNKTRLIPNQSKFKKLKVVPAQFYYNVSKQLVKNKRHCFDCFPLLAIVAIGQTD